MSRLILRGSPAACGVVQCCNGRSGGPEKALSLQGRRGVFEIVRKKFVRAPRQARIVLGFPLICPRWRHAWLLLPRLSLRPPSRMFFLLGLPAPQPSVIVPSAFFLVPLGPGVLPYQWRSSFLFVSSDPFFMGVCLSLLKFGIEVYSSTLVHIALQLGERSSRRGNSHRRYGLVHGRRARGAAHGANSETP